MARTKRVVLEIEVPVIYAEDLTDCAEFAKEHGTTESDEILNSLGELGVCRLRCEVAGEKDSDVIEVWGLITGAKVIDDPGVNDDEYLAELGSHRLLRDEKSCEWCDFELHSPETDPVPPPEAIKEEE